MYWTFYLLPYQTPNFLNTPIVIPNYSVQEQVSNSNKLTPEENEPSNTANTGI